MRDIGFYTQNIREDWALKKSAHIPEEEADDETLFALANGYMGVRGSLPLPCANGNAGTYIAGLYDKKETEEVLTDRGKVKNKALTPAYAIVPDSYRIRIEENGLAFDFINCIAETFSRTLDMRRGILFGKYTLENADKKRVLLETMQLVSAADRHLTLCKAEITPLNFDGELCVCFENSLCAFPQTIRRLKDYISPTRLTGAGQENGICTLRAEITETQEKIILLARTEGCGEKFFARTESGAEEIFRVRAECGKTCAFSKRAAYYTSRDGQAKLSADEEDVLTEAHIRLWERMWEKADVAIEGDAEVQCGVRWNIFSLLQVAYPESSDVSVSATGLSGQGYFGHVFWDTEIFLVPFYLAVLPEEAKSLLMYRCKRLDEAREVAKKEGCEGAKFPWTSAYTGNDVTPPDWAASSCREIHICGAIAYALHNYCLQTGDLEFYRDFGIETILETAKYYASRAEEGKDGKFHIRDVTGPDEYNIHVSDNYYTNYLAEWNIREALSQMARLKDAGDPVYARIAASAGFTDAVRDKLQKVADNMAYPRTRGGVLEQFDGFFDLKDAGGFERDGYGMPKDRKRVFDSGIQELKQPDVVMLHYLFPDDFSPEVQKASYLYYEQRCKHGSSLSPSVHCIAGLRNGITERAYGYLYLTALLDVKNLHFDKNLYEGVHIACAGGTWAALVYGFGGLRFCKEAVHIDPVLPEKWTKLSYSFLHRGNCYRVAVEKDKLTVCAEKDAKIYCKGKLVSLKAGVPYEAAL